MKDLRTRLIELLKSIVDKSNTKVSKQLLEHKIDKAIIYENNFYELIETLIYVINELTEMGDK